MSTGQKHLVKCRCVLPQYKKLVDPPSHRIVTFSIINDDGTVVPKFIQCPACGIVHHVIELGRSDIMINRESMMSIVTIDDIRLSLPTNLVTILDNNKADLASWEATQFIHENKKWGEFVVLTSDIEEGLRLGKYVRILGENLYKVEAFSRKEING